MKRKVVITIAAMLGVMQATSAETTYRSSATNTLHKVINVWEDTAGQWFSPHVHINAAAGQSSGDPQALATGHHDPNREGGSIQGVEIGASLRIHPYLEGFSTYNLSYGASKEWSDELEETFLKLRCPSDYGEIRGGRMLTRFGQHNAKHLHSWNSVDMPLVIGRFLGDDGLIIDGGDITGFIPVGDTLTFGAVFGYGERPNFDCDHGDDDEHDHHSHHAGIAKDDIYTGRLFSKFTPTDFYIYTIGLSGIGGEYDADALDSYVLGADFSIEWRENGFEPGGQRINWTTEVLYRSFDAEMEIHEEHSHEQEEHHTETTEDDFGETGFYTSLLYSYNQHLDTNIRLGWVEGISDLHQDERTRISPAITWWITAEHSLYARLQYNYDNIEGSPDEHSIWLQLGISLGKAEVR